MTSLPARVLFAASEVYPLVKTGGLADVANHLPVALRALGFDIRIVLPGYRAVLDKLADAQALALLDVDGAPVRLLRASLPGSDVPLLVVDAPALFDRVGDPYHDAAGSDWPDNARRFELFCAVIERICLGSAGIDWTPALFHGNDWHTGLVPALLSRYAGRPPTVFTIHSVAYQGNFSHDTFTALHLPPELWSPGGLEFHGMMSFIKGGLAYADRLVAVSPGYAREITTADYGSGMDGLLRHRGAALGGILNGVDYGVWDPRTDPHIASPYWINRLAGKRTNKSALQGALGLKQEDDAIVVAHIARLTYQKGIDLILAALPELLHVPELELVVLGAGDAALEQALLRAASASPGRVAAHLGYDETLAHRIQAGADVMLMPSRFEPCGLTHLYSLRYGTVPVARATGGLVDTVVDTSDSTLDAGTATGFLFSAATPRDLLAAMLRAVNLRRSGMRNWQRLMRAGMKQEFSWESSAQKYAALYMELLGRDR
ncbi:MAG: glycogen synthase GlgA [Gammaproteobacteria bacterium]|nr:glycogen synthase GlgA [Gammaproteobacteria bacterium]